MNSLQDSRLLNLQQRYSGLFPQTQSALDMVFDHIAKWDKSKRSEGAKEAAIDRWLDDGETIVNRMEPMLKEFLDFAHKYYPLYEMQDVVTGVDAYLRHGSFDTTLDRILDHGAEAVADMAILEAAELENGKRGLGVAVLGELQASAPCAAEAYRVVGRAAKSAKCNTPEKLNKLRHLFQDVYWCSRDYWDHRVEVDGKEYAAKIEKQVLDILYR